MMKRRDFLRTTTAAVSGLAVARGFAPLAAAQANSSASIEVLLDEPLGTISPNIYGHFVENLSGVIYDGIWVGENSRIPNINGIRKELVDEMSRIKPAVVRFPGGCFADSYDWRDGVGPREKRPRRTNFWAFGDSPVRSLPAEELYRWVEYCNSPAGSTTLADERSAAGFKDPFNVRYWGVGNEAWGCGGNFTPQAYATEFRRYTTWVPGSDHDLDFIGAGPDGANWEWTRGFFEEMSRKGKGQLRS